MKTAILAIQTAFLAAEAAAQELPESPFKVAVVAGLEASHAKAFDEYTAVVTEFPDAVEDLGVALRSGGHDKDPPPSPNPGAREEADEVGEPIEAPNEDDGE